MVETRMRGKVDPALVVLVALVSFGVGVIVHYWFPT